MFTLAKDITYGKITLVNALAQGCPHCEVFKQHIPELTEQAKALGIDVFNIEGKEENREFFEKYGNETIPYTFVFDNGKFVGGDSFDKNSFVMLINALSEKAA